MVGELAVTVNSSAFKTGFQLKAGAASEAWRELADGEKGCWGRSRAVTAIVLAAAGQPGLD